MSAGACNSSRQPTAAMIPGHCWTLTYRHDLPDGELAGAASASTCRRRLSSHPQRHHQSVARLVGSVWPLYPCDVGLAGGGGVHVRVRHRSIFGGKRGALSDQFLRCPSPVRLFMFVRAALSTPLLSVLRSSVHSSPPQLHDPNMQRVAATLALLLAATVCLRSASGNQGGSWGVRGCLQTLIAC